MTPSHRAIVFDLDGTLLDTLADIADSMNLALSELGLPPRPLDAYRFMVGDGLRVLAERALPQENRQRRTIDALTARMRTVYSERWDCKTRPYPGVPETLDLLAERGVALAVLSNKPHRFTTLTVDRFLGLSRFAAVLGQSEDTPPKPDTAGLERVLRDLGAPKHACLYVGDTKTDMITANRAGLTAVGVSWGFRPRAELREHGARVIIDRPDQLPALL